MTKNGTRRTHALAHRCAMVVICCTLPGCGFIIPRQPAQELEPLQLMSVPLEGLSENSEFAGWVGSVPVTVHVQDTFILFLIPGGLEGLNLVRIVDLATGELDVDIMVRVKDMDPGQPGPPAELPSEPAEPEPEVESGDDVFFTVDGTFPSGVTVTVGGESVSNSLIEDPGETEVHFMIPFTVPEGLNGIQVVDDATEDTLVDTTVDVSIPSSPLNPFK